MEESISCSLLVTTSPRYTSWATIYKGKLHIAKSGMERSKSKDCFRQRMKKRCASSLKLRRDISQEKQQKPHFRNLLVPTRETNYSLQVTPTSHPLLWWLDLIADGSLKQVEKDNYSTTSVRQFVKMMSS